MKIWYLLFTPKGLHRFAQGDNPGNKTETPLQAMKGRDKIGLKSMQDMFMWQEVLRFKIEVYQSGNPLNNRRYTWDFRAELICNLNI